MTEREAGRADARRETDFQETHKIGRWRGPCNKDLILAGFYQVSNRAICVT